MTGAAARTRPRGQNGIIACRGLVVSKEQGGLAEIVVAPGPEKNAFSSPSSNSAAAKAAIFAFEEKQNDVLEQNYQNILNKI